MKPEFVVVVVNVLRAVGRAVFFSSSAPEVEISLSELTYVSGSVATGSDTVADCAALSGSADGYSFS